MQQQITSTIPRAEYAIQKSLFIYNCLLTVSQFQHLLLNIYLMKITLLHSMNISASLSSISYSALNIYSNLHPEKKNIYYPFLHIQVIKIHQNNLKTGGTLSAFLLLNTLCGKFLISVTNSLQLVTIFTIKVEESGRVWCQTGFHSNN